MLLSYSSNCLYIVVVCRYLWSPLNELVARNWPWSQWRNSRSSYPKSLGHGHSREYPWSYRERHSLVRNFFQDPIWANRRTVKCKWSKKSLKADHADLSCEARKLSRVVENLAMTEKESWDIAHSTSVIRTLRYQKSSDHIVTIS